LNELVHQLSITLPQVASAYEVILVNDASRDRSWDVIARLAGEHSWIRGIHLMRNFGQQNALLAGIRAARYDVIVTMDDDLQHPPDQIPLLLAKLEEGHDVVYGTPLVTHQAFWRRLSTRFTRLILRWTTGVETAASGSAFRAFRTMLREAFASYAGPFVVIDVLLTWGTTRFAATPVRHDARRKGRSNYNFFKLAILAFDVTTSFSTWPLRLASLLGFAVTLMGLILLAFVLIDFLIDRQNLSVFRFLAAVLALFSGAQLFGLGIIGEYLARVHFRVMARPAYVVREHTNSLLETEVASDVSDHIPAPIR
jgi:glycosyltransferase involved in cell wall biosynthesis